MCCYSFSLPQWCIHVCFFLVPLSGLCVLTLGPVIPCAYMQSTSPSVLCCVVPHGCVLPHSMFAFLMQRFGSSSLFTCFFFHFSLIKPVMSLLLDSLSLVFGSKLCLALTLGSLYYCYGPWPRRKWAGLPVWKFKHARAHRWLAGRGTVPTQLDANHLCNCMSDLLV